MPSTLCPYLVATDINAVCRIPQLYIFFSFSSLLDKEIFILLIIQYNTKTFTTFAGLGVVVSDTRFIYASAASGVFLAFVGSYM